MAVMSNYLAAHVRTNHVHPVVHAPLKPAPVMKAFKARSSHLLNLSQLDPPDRKRWERHGSTPYLWSTFDLRNAVTYVLEEQGEPMEVFQGDLSKFWIQ